MQGKQAKLFSDTEKRCKEVKVFAKKRFSFYIVTPSDELKDNVTPHAF